MAELRSSQAGDVRIVYLTTARLVDEATIHALRGELNAALEAAASGKLLLNFKSVTQMSSVAFGALVAMNKRSKEIATRLKFCNVPPQVMDGFRITKLTRLFDIYDDEPQALAAFAEAK